MLSFTLLCFVLLSLDVELTLEVSVCKITVYKHMTGGKDKQVYGYRETTLKY